MPKPVGSIMRAATRPKDGPMNVLTFAVHERYQQGLAQSGHNFYIYQIPDTKTWDTRYAPVPANTTILNADERDAQVPLDVDIDIILSQHKFGQFQLADQLSRRWHVPLVSMEHTLPNPGWPDIHRRRFLHMRGDIDVFLSEYSVQAWGWPGQTVIIPPGIDTDAFVPEWTMPFQPTILSVVNDWINRDWACGYRLWQEVTRGLPVTVFGDTPGLSRPASGHGELLLAYQKCQVFLNTSLVSTCPFTLLEAMACGAAVVSTATTMIPTIIKDGVNGYISNDPQVLRRRCEELLADPEKCRVLGREARKTIEENHSFRQMAAHWDAVFQVAAEITPYVDWKR